MEVADGQDGGFSWESLVSGSLDQAQRDRIRKALLEYCGQDTLALVGSTRRLLLAAPHGHGNFGNPVPFDVGYGCANISTADLDGDGFLDLITSSGPVGEDGKGGIAVLRGLPNGEFGPPISYRAAAAGVFTSPDHIALRDFTGNGPLDIVVADYSPRETLNKPVP